MAHKVHPKVFRIKEIADWSSHGFYGEKPAELLAEDLKIRDFFKKVIGKLAIEKIEIERSAGKINIIIFSARPGLLIGRGGGGAEEIKKRIEKVLSNGLAKKEIKIEIREVRNPWVSAPLVSQWMVQQIEKRVSFRRVLKQAISKVTAMKEVQGVRVEIAGRLDGKEIARTEWLKKGKLPRQTLRADIDFAKAEAFCTYGTIGIKVWIYKGLKF